MMDWIQKREKRDVLAVLVLFGILGIILPAALGNIGDILPVASGNIYIPIV